MEPASEAHGDADPPHWRHRSASRDSHQRRRSRSRTPPSLFTLTVAGPAQFVGTLVVSKAALVRGNVSSNCIPICMHSGGIFVTRICLNCNLKCNSPVTEAACGTPGTARRGQPVATPLTAQPATPASGTPGTRLPNQRAAARPTARAAPSVAVLSPTAATGSAPPGRGLPEQPAEAQPAAPAPAVAVLPLATAAGSGTLGTGLPKQPATARPTTARAAAPPVAIIRPTIARASGTVGTRLPEQPVAPRPTARAAAWAPAVAIPPPAPWRHMRRPGHDQAAPTTPPSPLPHALPSGLRRVPPPPPPPPLRQPRCSQSTQAATYSSEVMMDCVQELHQWSVGFPNVRLCL